MKNYRQLFVVLFLFVVFPLSAQYATADINQTPKTKTVSGNVLTNDRGTNLTVQSVTAFNINSTLETLTLDVIKPIFTSTGVLAGQFQISSDGNYTFQPASAFVGDISINYTLKDNSNVTDDSSLTIKVIAPIQSGVNHPPIAHNDTSSTNATVPVSSNVLLNDSDANGNTLTVISASQGATGLTLNQDRTVSGINTTGTTISTAGTINLKPNGAYTFRPTGTFVGKINPITYTINDGAGGTNSAQIFIRVYPSTSNFTFANDDSKIKTKGLVHSGNVLSNDSDPKSLGQTVRRITISGLSQNVSQSEIDLIRNIAGVGIFKIRNTGQYVFTPEQSFSGSLPVVIQVCNSTGTACDNSTLYLTSLDTGDLCFQEIPGVSFAWDYQNSSQSEITQTMVQPGTNGGFVFDIYQLDNSFNMNINSIKLANKEIEFQTSGTTGQTIRFADGATYGQGSIPQIYNLRGNAANPIIRVVIDPFGNVSMYGSKTNYGPLLPLELFNNTNFNTISWNSSTSNNIIVTQLVQGPTVMSGYGYGRNIIPCATCTLPGNFSANGLPTQTGITSLRENNSNNWPQVREGAWIALESKTKGFVPNRLTNAQISAIPANQLVAGMMVYNITQDCLQINVNGSSTGWQCFTAPGCGE